MTYTYAMANNDRMKFSEWVKGERGRSLAIAQYLGISAPVVSDWVSGKKAIAAEHCKAIERFTNGAVTCREMRPHDWHKYWPELEDLQPIEYARAANA